MILTELLFVIMIMKKMKNIGKNLKSQFVKNSTFITYMYQLIYPRIPFQVKKKKKSGICKVVIVFNFS